MGYGSKRLLTLRVVGDSLAVILAWYLAGILRFYVIWGGVLPALPSFLNLFWLVWGLNIFFISQRGLYKESLGQSWRKETSDLFVASSNAFLFSSWFCTSSTIINSVVLLLDSTTFLLWCFWFLSEPSLHRSSLPPIAKGALPKHSSCWLRQASGDVRRGLTLQRNPRYSACRPVRWTKQPIEHLKRKEKHSVPWWMQQSLILW